MNRSELIAAQAEKSRHLTHADAELIVKTILDDMGQHLSRGDRIEIRGFGALTVTQRPARIGRNPKTGESVSVPKKPVPHFKPGKELRERVCGQAGQPNDNNVMLES